MKNYIITIILLLLSAGNANADGTWSTFISATRVAEIIQLGNVVLLDARSPSEYQQGHIPGAINIPGSSWRTAKAKPGQGDSQYIFQTPSGDPDTEKYEQLLSQAGIKNTDTVIVYGNHAGKADGSIPALLLRWLGHQRVAFLDGIGVKEWEKTGSKLSSTAAQLPATTYRAKPIPNFIWNLATVQNNLENTSVVFYDTRSLEEYSGKNPRSNTRAGHIPGAIQLDYKVLLDADKKVLSAKRILALHTKLGLTKDKTLVLYCQTATRVSLAALALFDLGYKNIAIYDASWHEYGNRVDTKIVSTPEKIALLD